MLRVDLARLDRLGSERIDVDLGPAEPLWADVGIEPATGFEVHLEARRAGPDVVVRGSVKGQVRGECRRCLAETRSGIEETVLLVFRAGIDAAQAEEQEVHVLPDAGRELDLTDALRQTLILAAPRYALCREACRGRCQACGVDLNVATCGCTQTVGDERWAALRRLVQ